MTTSINRLNTSLSLKTDHGCIDTLQVVENPEGEGPWGFEKILGVAIKSMGGSLIFVFNCIFMTKCFKPTLPPCV